MNEHNHREPNDAPRPGTPTAIAHEVQKASEAAMAEALHRAATEAASPGTTNGQAPASITPERLSMLVALGAVVESKAKEIGRSEMKASIRQEVGRAHDAIVGALSGTDPFIAVAALSMVKKQYLDAIYANPG